MQTEAREAGNQLRGALGALTLCCALSAGAARAQEVLEAGRNGLRYSTDNLEVSLGGRLHLDAAHIDDSGLSIEDEEIRRARLELSVRLYNDWRLRVDREFAHGGGWRNLWLSYDVTEALTLRAGNFIAPFSMEDVGSSNETMFLERSLSQELAPGFDVGVAALYQGRRFTLAGGYFGDALDAEDNTQIDKGRGVAARGTWSPIENRRQVVHVGVGLERREFDAGAFRRIASGPEASLAPSVVTTGTLTDIDTSMSYNIEGAYSFGPVLVQGQFISTDLARNIGADVSLSSYYLQAGWIVTGERHRYGDAAGVFTGPNPRNSWGAVELAARVSSLDLSEGVSSRSGEANDYAFGANWYLGRNFRLMGNYVHSEVTALDPLRDRDVDVLEARAQIDF